MKHTSQRDQHMSKTNVQGGRRMMMMMEAGVKHIMPAWGPLRQLSEEHLRCVGSGENWASMLQPQEAGPYRAIPSRITSPRVRCTCQELL